MNEMRNRFLFDEIKRLYKSEEDILQARNIILTQLLSIIGIGSVFLGAISRNAFYDIEKVIFFEPSFLLATIIIIGFMFLGCLLCWLRLLNGTASLSIVRANIAFIRKKLADIGYKYPSYLELDINTADEDDYVNLQIRGFTNRTIFAFRLFISAISVICLTIMLILGYLIDEFISNISLRLSYSVLVFPTYLIIFSIITYQHRIINKITKKQRKILGKAFNEEIKPSPNLLT